VADSRGRVLTARAAGRSRRALRGNQLRVQSNVQVTHYSDPGCPWAYSASPALAALRWRFGAQLDWRLVLIGLTEDAQQYVDRGYTPLMMTSGYLRFRARWGMPFATAPKPRVAATSRACRAVIVARRQDPRLGDAAFRVLQLLQFTSPLPLDDDAALRLALEAIPALDAEAAVGAIDDPDVVEAYERDRALARTAEATPTDAQGKTARTDGLTRYTAPSLVFERGGAHLEAGGFQPLEAYDVVLANLAPDLDRRPAPDHVREALAEEPLGLTTAEAAEVLRSGNDAPDLAAAERQLVEAAADGDALRVPVGSDALWLAPRYAGEDGSASLLRASSIAAVSGVMPPAAARS
jgi:2-hydroxychromene-2-carboxylate isomerase